MAPVLFAVALLAQGPASPTSSDSTVDPVASLRIDPALEVRLWAQSPQLFNPTAIDVDARGRVWVAEAVNYRQWRGRNPGLHHDAGDRIVILEDSDGDGTCDRAKTFVQESELVAPLGICVVGSQVIVSCSPDVIVYTDADGDDVPEKREVLLTGFGGRDHDHGLHSFVPGPDGRWYFNTGNAGPHIVRDARGWTLRSGSLYSDGGEHLADNHPGLLSDDGRAWTGGLILSVARDGGGLGVLAHNFRNNYEVALDSFGNLWQADNDDDGNASCRTLFCMRGGNHGYFSADGARFWNADRRPGQGTQTAHWHQDDPGVVPAGCINGGGGPTGVCVYEGALLSSLRGAVLDCDAGAGVVYAHRPRAQGAGFALEKSALIERSANEKDPQRAWFRPSDVCVAPDGSLFVSDWWDPGVGGHAAGDREAYGRILRVTPKGARVAPVRIDASTLEGAVDALRSPNLSARELGRRKLAESGATAWPALRGLLASADRRERARALWIVAALGDAGRVELEKALRDPDVDVRVVAWRALSALAPFPIEFAKRLASSDAPPALAREIAISLRDVELASMKDTWLALATRLDPSDRWMLEALGIAAQGREAELYAAFAGDSKQDPLAWSPQHAALAWRLHPPAAIAGLAQRANATSLAPDQRRAAVDALAFCKQREAADAMVNLALAGPSDVRELAAWWVRHRDENDWAEYQLARDLAPVTREGAKKVWSSGVIESGSKACDVDITGARAVWLVVTSGTRGNGHDWSDWLDPVLVDARGAETKLDTLPWSSAKAEWGEVRAGKNPGGGALKLAGKEYAHGIGAHAASEIVWRLPEGQFTRLRALGALDDGGTQQAGGRPDVEFEVWIDVPEDRTRFRQLAQIVADAKSDDAARAKAAKELASDREGGLLLVRLADEGKLPASAREAAAQVIHANADYAVRALAARSFPRARPGVSDGQPQPSPKEIAAMPGDARRGRATFFGEQAGCSKCHVFQGRGGDIGPDLTAVASKYGREALIDAILNPSAGISFGYDTWLFETQDERLVSGFLLADGEKVVVKETSGRRVVLDAQEIVAREKQKVSAMPDDVSLGIEPQAIADIAALLGEKTGGAYTLGAPLALFDGKSLAGWTFHLNDPKARMEDVWSVKDGILHCAGNPIGYLRTERDFTSFELQLDWRFPPGSQPGNSGVLLRVQAPDKVWPKSIEAQLQHRSAGDIWNIDEFPMDVERTRTEGRHTEKLAPSNEKPIGEWNHYRIVLNKGELLLEVNGLVQNTARWCEIAPGKIALQSEGAAIEFKDVVLRPIE